MQVKPVEGPSNFMHITEGCNNMKLQAQASARWLPKHSWNRHANDEGSNNWSPPAHFVGTLAMPHADVEALVGGPMLVDVEGLLCRHASALWP